MDIIPSELFNGQRERFESLDLPLFPISAVTGEGIETLKAAMLEVLQSQESEDGLVLLPALQAQSDQHWDVTEEDGTYRILGKRISRMVEMTDLNNPEALRYLHRRLERIGVIDKLRLMGVQEGNLVMVGGTEFAFSDES
jgi:GTP-binding protein